MMLIIVKENRIAGVDKDLLNTLDIDLFKLSDFVNALNLQLSSLQNDPIEINGNTFQVKELPLVTTENIKAFELTSSNINAMPETFETAPQEEPSERFEDSLSAIKDDLLVSTTNESSFEEPKLTLPEDEDFQVIPQTEEEEPKPFEVEVTEQEENEEIEIPAPEKPQEKLITYEDDVKIEFENSQPTSSEFTEISLPESESIELMFEDDLDEIRKILEMKKEDFNDELLSELEKASKELGIDKEDTIPLYNELVEQIKDEKSVIYKFIQNKDYDNLHKSYHKLKGAALNLRLSKIALILKTLDELSKNRENIDKIKQITDDFYKLIENEAIVLEDTTTQNSAEKEKAKNPDALTKNIILQTIQNYLQTQNEAQFQKDKKYIEKILNTKIDSIEDLQKIIKGI